MPDRRPVTTVSPREQQDNLCWSSSLLTGLPIRLYALRDISDSGRQALISGEPVVLIPALRWHENCSYPFFETLSRKASASGWTIENVEYGQDVTCDIKVPEDSNRAFIRFCLDASGGAIVPGEPEKILMKGEKISIS